MIYMYVTKPKVHILPSFIPWCHAQYHIILYNNTDWKAALSDEGLVLYTLSTLSQCGIQVVYSITIIHDFSFSLSFRGVVVNVQNCGVLRGLSPVLNSGNNTYKFH